MNEVHRSTRNHWLKAALADIGADVATMLESSDYFGMIKLMILGCFYRKMRNT